jgi:transposase
MPATYSIDLRQRIINAYQTKQRLEPHVSSQTVIAERFQVSLSFVKRLIGRYQQTGSVKPKSHGGGAIAMIKQSDLEQIKQLVDEQPDALLRELCERWSAKKGMKISISTMHRQLQKLQLTTKKTLYAKEQETPRVKKMRFDYQDWALGIDPHNLVFIDESGINLGMTRLKGRAMRGERLYDCCPRNRGSNISLIGALSLDGLIATMSLPGS